MRPVPFDRKAADRLRAKRIAAQPGRSGPVAKGEPDKPGVRIQIANGKDEVLPAPDAGRDRKPVLGKRLKAAPAVPPPPQPNPVEITDPDTGRTYWGFQFDPSLDIDCHYTELYRAFDNKRVSTVGPSCLSDPDARWLGVLWVDWWGGVYHGLVHGQEYYAKIQVQVDGEWSPFTTTAKWKAVGKPGLGSESAAGTCVCDSSVGWRVPLWNERGDPINMATGAFTERFTDAQVSAPGIGFAPTRSYDSNATALGSFGKGWSFAYDAALWVDPVTDAVVYFTEDGQQIRYNKSPSGYLAPAGTSSKLTKVDSGYRLTTRNSETLTFNTEGALRSWKDAAGQGLSIVRNASEWQITDAAGREYVLERNTSGRLTKITLPDGRSLQYGYDQDLLTTYTDLRGKVWTYEYTGNRLAKIKDPKGRYVVQNTYAANKVTQVDANGQTSTWTWNPDQQKAEWKDLRGTWTEYYDGNILRKQIDPRGGITEYGYDDRLNRTSVKNPRGVVKTWEYDALGRLKAEKNAAPWDSFFKTWTYHGDSDDVATYKDWRGMVTTYTYNAAHQPKEIKETSKDGSLTRTRTIEYNTRGQVAAEVSFEGRRTEYTYDGQGNLRSKTTGEGNTTSYEPDTTGRLKTETDPRGAKTVYGYDDADHITSITDPRGHETTFAFDEAADLASETDPRGKTTTYSYNAAHQITSKTRPGLAPEEWAYHPDGLLWKHTDPEGAATKYGYNEADQLTSMRTPRGNLGDNNEAKYTWIYGYDGAGNRETVKDPSGRVWTTYHNALDWPTDYTDPLGNKTHHSMGSGTEIVKITDPLGHVTQHNYDGLGRYANTITPRGKQTTFGNDKDGLQTSITTPLGHKRTYTYDKDGRLATEVDPRGNATGADPAKYTWTYGYDRSGNQTSVKDPLGNETKSVFDLAGNLESRTDANGHTTKWSWDAKDRITTTTGPDGGETVYGYNDLDDLTSRTDPRANVTTYGYDANGRVIETVDPLGRKISHKYDPEGNLAQTVTARGNAPGGDKAKWTLGYEWDARNLLTAVRSPDAGVAATFDYYADNRRKSSTSLAGSIGYTWDNAGRLKTYNGWSYEYDDDSHVTKRTTPGGSQLNATWDSDGRQITSDRGGVNLTKFYYDAAGNRTRTLFPDTTKRIQDRGFDHAGRLAAVTNKHDTAITSAFTVTRDPVGNPKTVKQQRDTSTVYKHYGYDNADRLTTYCQTPTADSCTGATASIAYGYDPAGNKTSEARTGAVPRPGETTYTIDAADQITKSTTGGVDTPYEYDADGNLTTAGTATYSHDVLNRQRALANTSGSFGYTYNADGHRTGLSTQGQTLREYQWDPNYPDGLPRMGVTAQGTNRQGYRYLDDGTPIELWQTTASSPALNAAETDATDAAFLHTDHVGNVVDSTDAADGHHETIADFEPYGWRTRTRLDTTAPLPGLGYTGEYHDPNTGGHIHLRARQLDPVLGSFTSRDRIQAGPELPYTSPYGYGFDNPLRYRDPSGLWPDVDWGRVLEAAKKGGRAAIDFGAGAVITTGTAVSQGAAYPVFELLGANERYNAQVARMLGKDPGSVWFEAGSVTGIPFLGAGTAGSKFAGVGGRALLRALFSSAWWKSMTANGGWRALIASERGSVKLPWGAGRCSRIAGHTRDDLRRAASVIGKNHLTVAARGLQKHGDRSGLFPYTRGKAAEMNARAQAYVDQILSDPNGSVEILDRVIDIYDSSGRGIRFRLDGTFQGFLETK